MTGFDSAGLGLVSQFDDSDDQNSPTRGRSFTVHNFAYREALGGEDSFDTLNLEYKHCLPHGDGNILTMRVSGRWTSDAQAGGYSSVSLRGYTRGQYLAPHSTTLEVEDRRHLKGRFGMHFFAGITCLYGKGRSCDDQDNLYPAIGAGMQYQVKPAERLVITMDVAKSKADNSGFYLRFEQAF